MTFERSIPMDSTSKLNLGGEVSSQNTSYAFEDSVVAHLSKILLSDEHSTVISSAKLVFISIFYKLKEY